MNNLLATYGLYRDCFIGATKSVWVHWIVILGSVAAYFAYIIAVSIFGRFGLAGGFILGIIQIGLLSLYYIWLQAASNRERLNIKDLLHFDFGMFMTAISVAFVISIALLLISPFTARSDSAWVVQLIQFGAVIVFNAIPEVIYLNRSQSISALAEAFDFVKTHWIEWFIPLLIIAAPMIAYDGKLLLLELSKIEVLLLPAFLVVKIWSMLGPFTIPMNIVLGIVLANWFMLFRALLFKELQSGGRRRRIYRNNL